MRGGLNRLFCSTRRKCMRIPFKGIQDIGRYSGGMQRDQVVRGKNKEGWAVSIGETGLLDLVTSRWNVN